MKLSDLPWYVKHVLVALAIMAALAFLPKPFVCAIGASLLYVGREQVEWSKYGQSKKDTLLGFLPALVITNILAALWWWLA